MLRIPRPPRRDIVVPDPDAGLDGDRDACIIELEPLRDSDDRWREFVVPLDRRAATASA